MRDPMMPKKLFFFSTLLISMVVLLGFAVTFAVGYDWNIQNARRDTESIAMRSSENVRNQIGGTFAEHINVSRAMANNSLLRELLATERKDAEGKGFTLKLCAYLQGYQEACQFSSVFLASAQTSTYYHYRGTNRLLSPLNQEDGWYYRFLDEEREYALEIESDPAAGDVIMVFANSRILDEAGSTLGVVGVGFVMDELQQLLAMCIDQYCVNAYLMNQEGEMRVSAQEIASLLAEGEGGVDAVSSATIQDVLLAQGEREEPTVHWRAVDGRQTAILLHYVPEVNWYLVIEHDYASVEAALNAQIGREMVITIVILLLICLIIAWLYKRFNTRIVAVTLQREQSHQKAFDEETRHLYESIHELNITRNRIEAEATQAYFLSLGIPPNTPLDRSLEWVAQSSIKEEYRKGYVDTFTPKNVLSAMHRGESTLQYELLIRHGSEEYHWMRIIGRIFEYPEDGTVRMFTYRQNIDDQKRREAEMLDKADKDSLTGLYNKGATAACISALLKEAPSKLFALLILDIDNFKQVNDQFGHAIGDSVIVEFAAAIQKSFRNGDIVGRIGGDEFVVFLSVPSREWIGKKTGELVLALCRRLLDESPKACDISASIGIAIAPDHGTDFETLYKTADKALYETKARGKNGYTVFRAK